MSYEPMTVSCFYHGKPFLLSRPDDPCELIESDSDTPPYWAEEWPSSEIALDHLPDLIKDKERLILEIGAGAGTVSVRLNSIFPNYIAADYVVDGCLCIEENRRRNRGTLLPIAMDWNHSPFRKAFHTIVGIDILYEREMIDPVLAFIRSNLTDSGEAIIFDPQRFYWEEFKEKLKDHELEITSSFIEKSSSGSSVECIVIGRKR